MIGWHRDDPRLGIFNGLGSKGVLYSPGVSMRFAKHLCDGAEIDSELDVQELGSESGE